MVKPPINNSLSGHNNWSLVLNENHPQNMQCLDCLLTMIPGYIITEITELCNGVILRLMEETIVAVLAVCATSQLCKAVMQISYKIQAQ